MQPYFFPYLGYFHLIDAVDCFVVLDDVDYAKNGWINRNRILINSEVSWFTVPVYSTGKRLTEKRYALDARFFDTARRKISFAYGNSALLGQILWLFDQWEASQDTRVASVNTMLLQAVCELVGIRKPVFMASSEMSLHRELTGQQRVYEICKQVGASKYVNLPGGATLYSSEEFQLQGLGLRFVESQFLPYPQRSTAFVPGLSVLDLLLNCSTGFSDWAGTGSYQLSPSAPKGYG
jgi:hypothetical protein